MKKIISVCLVLTMMLALAACGSSNRYSLGEMVSTDIAELTLDDAQFTVALNNTIDDDYYLPKEYESTDGKNPHVAPKGSSIVFVEFTLKNIDRTSLDIDNFITVEYGGKKYSSDFKYGAKSADGFSWERYGSSNILLSAGEKRSVRSSIEIPVEPKDFTETVNVIFSLPESSGGKVSFEYSVTEEARLNKGEKEVTLDVAISRFTEDEGQKYFAEHMSEYEAVAGADISSMLPGRKWNVVYIIEDIGHWKGNFWFKEEGTIKDDYGYVNKRTWSVEGDTLIIDGEHNCIMKKIESGMYLLEKDGKPYMLLK